MSEHMEQFELVVIGAGPAGLAAAGRAAQKGAKSVLVLERNDVPGGILNQCIHDGFGVERFSQSLTGPEYVQRFLPALSDPAVTLKTSAMVLSLSKERVVTYADRTGLHSVQAGAIVLATGCRERTRGAIGVPGARPAGVYTAGVVQRLVNVENVRVGSRAVILGSGDIGLIMARRLTLEGASVAGVYEAKPTPSGLMRNVSQCLTDFGIPLHVSKTVTRLFGGQRLEAVEIASVDDCLCPIPGTEEIVPCDALILSVGLIPENELAESIGVPLDPKTKGAFVDERGETLVDGVFACGNALHVNDLVDYVSESGETAGKAAANGRKQNRSLLPVTCEPSLLYVVPQRLDRNATETERVFFFRSSSDMDNAMLRISRGERVLYSKKYAHLRPPEMERLVLNLSAEQFSGDDPLVFSLEGTNHE